MGAEFPFQLPYPDLDLRSRPDLYRIGKGEQGVLSVEPYKSELLPLWRFKNPEVATQSRDDLMAKFEEYKEAEDLVGMDMTRKFMQMGYTRARRYANHKGGKKYSTVDGKKTLIPRLDIADQEPDKVKAAEIFAAQLAIINADKTYIRLREKHKLEHESQELDLSEIDVVKGVPEKRGGEAKGEVGKRNKKAAKKE